MKTIGHITILAIGLALMGSGCASLRPPADDKAFWEYQKNQQSQEAQKTESYDWYWLTLLGAVVMGVNPSTNCVITTDSSFHSFSK
jgi:hypothetical protein